MTKYIAHRGDARIAKENTVEAFSKAFDNNADGIELDVYLNDSQEVYVTHSLLHNKKKNYPLLKDILKEFIKKGRIIIEIKDSNPLIINALAKIIYPQYIQNIEINTSIHTLLLPLKKTLPNIYTGIIIKDHHLINGISNTSQNIHIKNLIDLTDTNILWIVDFTYQFWNEDRMKWFHSKDIEIGMHIRVKNSKELQEIINHLKLDYILLDNLSLIPEQP